MMAASLPMAVPIFNQRNDDDYEEVFVEKMKQKLTNRSMMMHVSIASAIGVTSWIRK